MRRYQSEIETTDLKIGDIVEIRHLDKGGWTFIRRRKIKFIYTIGTKLYFQLETMEGELFPLNKIIDSRKIDKDRIDKINKKIVILMKNINFFKGSLVALQQENHRQLEYENMLSKKILEHEKLIINLKLEILEINYK